MGMTDSQFKGFVTFICNNTYDTWSADRFRFPAENLPDTPHFQGERFRFPKAIWHFSSLPP